MRLTSVVRPDPVDRNPLTATLEWVSGNVAPHADTVRAQAPVGAGRRMKVSYVRFLVRRRTVATTPQFAWGGIQINGGAILAFAQLGVQKNAIGDQELVVLTPPDLVILAGQTLNIVTSDSSTGGSVDYELSFTGMLYDA